MKARFVKVSNVGRFQEAVAGVGNGAAAEKQIAVVAAEPGLGKSRTGAWWGVQHQAVMLLAHRHMSPGQVLSSLLTELGCKVPHSRDRRWAEAVETMAKSPRPIMVDEVEDALADNAAALDELRKLVDLVQVPLVLLGRAHIAAHLARHPQIWRRVGAVCEFSPLSASDIRYMADELVEGPVADDLVPALERAYRGLVDNTLHYGLAHIDAWCRRHPGETATAAAVGALPEPLAGARRTAELVAHPRSRGRATSPKSDPREAEAVA